MDSRVLAAQSDSHQADELLGEYLPMVKKQVLETISRGADYEDMLSIGMLAFANAIKQYKPERGQFIAFARLCIRSRVLDELRKNNRGKIITIPLAIGEEGQPDSGDMEASLAEYSRELEHRTLVEEIAALREELSGHGIQFDSLVRLGPKQKRSRSLCITAAHCVLADHDMRSHFKQNAHLMPTELAARLGVSLKTIEQYRRYIVALLVILQGDYPCIRAFLPTIGEVRK